MALHTQCYLLLSLCTCENRLRKRQGSRNHSDDAAYSTGEEQVKFFSLKKIEDKRKYYFHLQVDTVHISKTLKIGAVSE